MDDNSQTTDLLPEESNPDIEAISDKKEVNELLTVEGSIKTHIKMLSELKDEQKKINEMLKSYLENDETYMKAVENAKKANGLKNQAKKALLSTPEGSEIHGKSKGLSEQKRELSEGLSYYLREYQRMTGQNIFEDDEGEVMEIVYVAKLVKRSNFEK